MQPEDFIDHASLIAHEEDAERMTSQDMVVSILTETDSVILLQEAAKTDAKAAGFLLALNGSVSEFNVMSSHAVGIKQQALLSYLVAVNAITEICRVTLISYANYKHKPFSKYTQLQFNQAKKIYTEKQVLGYTQGRDIKITLVDAITEDFAITTWSKDNGFDYDNVGKLAHVNTDNTLYKLRMNSVKVDGDLFVRVPFENFDFTVELI